jgi:hypothetical protein
LLWADLRFCTLSGIFKCRTYEKGSLVTELPACDEADYIPVLLRRAKGVFEIDDESGNKSDGRERAWLL